MNVSMSIRAIAGVLLFSGNAARHGTVIEPISRVYRVYLTNPEGPDFVLAAAAVAMDGTQSYYNWHELSRNISEAVPTGQSGRPTTLDSSFFQ